MGGRVTAMHPSQHQRPPWRLRPSVSPSSRAAMRQVPAVHSWRRSPPQAPLSDRRMAPPRPAKMLVDWVGGAPYSRSRQRCPWRSPPTLRLSGKGAGRESSANMGMWPILVISCLNLIGYCAVMPITADLIRLFDLQSDANVGIMSSSFAVGRLCTSGAWPMISDYIGRRRVLIIALVGGGIGALLQGAAVSLQWPFVAFLAARGLSGMFSGVVPVVKAHIGDSFPRDRVPTVLAYREAASTMAFVIGPIVGGLVAARMLALPLFLSSVASFASAFLASKCLRETLAESASPSGNGGEGGGAVGGLGAVDAQGTVVGGASTSAPFAAAKGGCEESAELLTTSPGPAGASRPSSTKAAAVAAAAPPPRPAVKAFALLPLLVLSFTWSCTRTCFHAYSPLVLARNYGLSPARVGTVLTIMSLFVACVQVGGFEQARRRAGLRGTLLVGGVLISLGLTGLASSMGNACGPPPFSLFLAFWVVYAFGVALLSPAMPAMVVQAAPRGSFGALLGFESIIANFGRIVAPPVFGLRRFDQSIRWSAAGMTAATTIIAIIALLPAAAAGAARGVGAAARRRQEVAGANGRGDG